MTSKNMKNYVPFVFAIIVIYVYITFVSSFDLAVKYSIFPLILAFLFYYDFTLAIIAIIIFSAIFIYNTNYSKYFEKVNYHKKTSHFKLDDNVDNEYDYINVDEVNNDDLNNDETHDHVYQNAYDDINEDMNIDDLTFYSTFEAMSNKRRNMGIDRISVEQSIRSKDSNTLLISKNFATKEKREPISVGKEGTMSGYTMMDHY